MSKKDFIALADALRPVVENASVLDGEEVAERVTRELADFCAAQNPKFKRDRWLGYLRGENGPGGGPIKPTPAQKRARAGLIPSDPRDHEPESARLCEYSSGEWCCDRPRGHKGGHKGGC